MLSAAILGQRFESVARRNSKIIERSSIVDKTQLPQRDCLNIRRQSPAAPTVPDRHGLGIAKAYDHKRL
jgi:hypothetical protein